jgi:hypothetical protein
MPVVKKVRDHHMEFDGDVVFVKFCGDETAADAQEFIAQMQAMYGKSSYYLVLDASGIGHVDAEARRVFGAWLAQNCVRGAAIYGATTMVHTFARLTESLVRLVGRKIVPLMFVKNHQEALAWIGAQRRKDPSPA